LPPKPPPARHTLPPLKLKPWTRNAPRQVTLKLLERGAAHSRENRARALKAAAIALLVSAVCALTLLLGSGSGSGPSLAPWWCGRPPAVGAVPGEGRFERGGASFVKPPRPSAIRSLACGRFFSAGGMAGGAAGGGGLIVAAVENLGNVLLVVGVMAFSALAAVVALSGLLADSAQERAQAMIAQQVKLVSAAESFL
jgi:hypothetical protein